MASIKSKRLVDEHFTDDSETLAGLTGEEDAQRAFAEFLHFELEIHKEGSFEKRSLQIKMY